MKVKELREKYGKELDCEECREWARLNHNLHGGRNYWDYMCNAYNSSVNRTCICRINEFQEMEVQDVLNLFISSVEKGCFVSECHRSSCNECVAERMISDLNMVNNTKKVIKEWKAHESTYKHSMGLLYDDVLARLKKLESYEELDKKGKLKIVPAFAGEKVWMFNYFLYYKNGELKLCQAIVEDVYIFGRHPYQGQVLVGFPWNNPQKISEYRAMNIRDFSQIAIPVMDLPSLNDLEAAFDKIKESEIHKKYVAAKDILLVDQGSGFRKGLYR